MTEEGLKQKIENMPSIPDWCKAKFFVQLDKTIAVIKEEMKLYDGRYNRGLKFCLKALDNRTIKTIKQNGLSVYCQGIIKAEEVTHDADKS